MRMLLIAALMGCQRQTGDTPDVADSDEPADEEEPATAAPCDDLPWKQVVAGVWMACGVHTDGCAECWGHEPWSDGEFDTGREAWNDHGDEHPPDDAFLQIDVVNDWGGANGGSFHGCGVRTDGTLRCWGRNDWGESDAPEGVYRSVAVAEVYSCALGADGAAVCWGEAFGDRYELGANLTSISAGAKSVGGLDASGAAYTWATDVDVVHAYEPVGPWLSIDVAGVSCAIEPAGDARCWRTGHEPSEEFDPEFEEFWWKEGPFTQVCHGDDFRCALDLEGRTACWGDVPEWHAEFPDAKYASLSCSAVALCGLTSEGNAACVGQPWGPDQLEGLFRPPGSFVVE